MNTTNEKVDHRYPTKFGKYSSHTQITQFINIIGSENKNKTIRILDIGCSQGEMLSTLTEYNFELFGIEPDAQDADFARLKGINVFTGTIEEYLKVENYPKNFDLIILADVLEHLSDENSAISQITTKLLNQKGKLIVSVPNVANFSIRLLLLFGMWNYTSRGILDRTHLRFFTRKTIKETLKNHNLTIESLNYTTIPLEQISPIFLRAPFNVFEYLLHFLTNFLPRFFAYQFIVVTKKSS